MLANPVNASPKAAVMKTRNFSAARSGPAEVALTGPSTAAGPVVATARNGRVTIWKLTGVYVAITVFPPSVACAGVVGTLSIDTTMLAALCRTVGPSPG